MGKLIALLSVVLVGCTSPTAPDAYYAQQVDRINLYVRWADPVRPGQLPILVTIETTHRNLYGVGNQTVVLQATAGRLDRTQLVTDAGGVSEVRAWPDAIDRPMSVRARHQHTTVSITFTPGPIGSMIVSYTP